MAHADRRTVLVFAEKHGSVSVGTGFFIGEQQVLTNAHVVEGGTDVGILSHVFEGLTRAEVAHIGTGGADFALLVLSDVRAPDHFVLTRQVARLDTVVAVGYPGVVMETSAEYQRIATGQVTEAPAAVTSRGEVTSIHTSSEHASITLVGHTAHMARGNSGGPLIDRCGRVVGVNTFIVRQADDQALVALSTASLLATLATWGAVATESTAPCPR